MSDTPETEEAMAQVDDYMREDCDLLMMFDHSRRLERERDAARNAAEVFRAAVEEWHGNQVPFPRRFGWETEA